MGVMEQQQQNKRCEYYACLLEVWMKYVSQTEMKKMNSCFKSKTGLEISTRGECSSAPSVIHSATTCLYIPLLMVFWLSTANKNNTVKMKPLWYKKMNLYNSLPFVVMYSLT